MDPMRILYVGGVKHFGYFVDIFFRKVWVYVTEFKEEKMEKFKMFQTFVGTQLEHEIKAFQQIAKETPF